MIFGPPFLALFLVYYIRASGPASPQTRQHILLSTWIACLNIALSLVVWVVLARHTLEYAGDLGSWLLDRILGAEPAPNNFRRI
jgi:hypothetical protein